MNKKVFFLAMALTVSGCAYLGYLRDPFVDIPNFSRVNDNLYRGGWPTAKGYAKLKNLGIKTIVNLAGPDKRQKSEQQAAAQYGFNIINIPLSVYTWPEDDKVLTFLKTALDPAAQPVFVHCTRGRDLTGTMIAVYRVIVESKGPKEGYKEALRHGFWPYRGEVVLKKYIHQLKDRRIFYDFIAQYRDQQKKKGNP